MFDNKLKTMQQQQHNDEMNLAWQYLTETNVSVFLTGKAGTGKTTFLRKLRELSPKRMVILAPTGVAAINAQGQTIHSFFQLPFGPVVPEMQRERKSYYKVGKDKKNIIRTLDLLVIDEISMVRCDLLDAIDEELRKYKDRTRPFGGVQLLLIGDLQQLAPVSKESEWQLLSQYYDTPYFFGSRALKMIQYVTIELKHVYRQTDSSFIDILAKIRNNTIDDATLSALNSRFIPGFVPPEGEDWIRLTTHNNSAQQYNEHRLCLLNSGKMEFTAEIKGNFPESNYPADQKLILKPGAQVMFIKNDSSGAHAYYNGKIGVVKGVGEKEDLIVWCKEDNANISVGKVEWENTKYVIDPKTNEIKEEVDGQFKQYPLRLAWAITVHKSQGLTFNHAVLDINQSFAHGQAYVALSRCRSLEGLVLSRPMDAHSVITDGSVDKYVHQKLEEAETTSQYLPQMKMNYFVSLLDELFSFVRLKEDYFYLTRVVDEHLYRPQRELLAMLKSRQESIDTALVSVSLSFRNQYLQIINEEGYKSQHLQERLKASADYFLKKQHDIFEPIQREWKISIGNKIVNKQYSNARESLEVTLRIKEKAFKSIIDDGFSVNGYLKSKANGLLDILDVAPKAKEKKNNKNLYSLPPYSDEEKEEKKPKKEKKKKGDSERETFDMFRSGMTIAEIAKARSLTESTIFSHMSSFVLSGDLPLDKLVSKERQTVINKAIKSLSSIDQGRFKAVKELLPEDYSYGEIRLCSIVLDRKE